MNKASSVLRNKKRELVVIIAIILMTIIFTSLNTTYFTWNNFLSIMQQATINGVPAVGMTFAIISGGIDLSIGCTFAIVIVTVGKMTASGINPFLAIIIGVVLGFAMGAINGILITKDAASAFHCHIGYNECLSRYRLCYYGWMAST